MIEFYKIEHPPYKLFVSDLHRCKKSANETWSLDIKFQNPPRSKCISVNNVWLQGYIEQTTGTNNEILIINDKTGKFKVLKCSSVPGDNSWLAKGVYCAVIGTFIKQSNVPEVAAVKLTKLDENSVHASMWPSEVKEMKLLLTNQVLPSY